MSALSIKSRSKLLEAHHETIDALWTEWSALLTELTERQFKQDQLPQPSFFKPFREDTQSNLKRIQSLTQQLLGHFKTSRAQELKSSYFELKTKIEAERKEAIMLAEDRYEAPREGEAWFWETHQGDFEDLIHRKDEAIKALKEEQIELLRQCHEYLVSLGILLKEEQVEHLFKMTSGDVMLDLLVTFAHLNLLIEVVTDRMKSSQEDHQYLKRSEQYYGIYVALVTLSLDLHRQTRTRINSTHIPKISHLVRSVKQMTDDTRALIKDERRRARRSAAKDHKAMLTQLKKNLKVQETSLRGARAYRSHLREQEKQVKLTEDQIARRLRVAVNTYRTVRLSSSQLTLIEEGLRDLNNLRRIHLPAMVPLADERVRSLFDAIDNHMRGEAPLFKGLQVR